MHDTAAVACFSSSRTEHIFNQFRVCGSTRSYRKELVCSRMCPALYGAHFASLFLKMPHRTKTGRQFTEFIFYTSLTYTALLQNIFMYVQGKDDLANACNQMLDSHCRDSGSITGDGRSGSQAGGSSNWFNFPLLITILLLHARFYHHLRCAVALTKRHVITPC